MSQRMAFRILSVALPGVILVLGTIGILSAQETQRMQDTKNSAVWLEAGHPPVKEARFKSVKVEGGARYTESRGISLHFSVSSAHDKPLWLKVEFKSPSSAVTCEQYRQLAPGKRAAFVCPSPDLEPHAIYPIVLTLYTSKELDTVLEKGTNSYRFTKAEVAALVSTAETFAQDREDD